MFQFFLLCSLQVLRGVNKNHGLKVLRDDTKQGLLICICLAHCLILKRNPHFYRDASSINVSTTVPNNSYRF
jgi:hypothetical protein